ncbi:deoxyribonuclease IV [Haloplanus rubicundus]|uniref:Deoxyribonuclease IV n=1 Tax=Haloplanus rubicundus TaxID=1547898 RepID=A0A345EHV4_9EURY|nr:deoxyribonuclease IV [Haloplanus rubicundus]
MALLQQFPVQLPVSVDVLVVLAVIVVALVLFIFQPVSIDTTAIALMVVLILLGPWTGVSPEEGVSGFSNPATITVLAMFVLSEGVRQTGIIQILTRKMETFAGDSESRQLLATVGLGGPSAGFVNNTPIVAVLIPAVTELARKTGTSPSKLLIPLSFAAMLGGMLTVIGTSTNLLASKSLDCVQDELDAAATLDVPYYVFHPGAHTGAGEEMGIENVGERLSEVDVPSNVTLLLENTAGKGTTVGKRLEDLDDMVEASVYGYGDLGIYLDTCHLFAAGYDFTDEAAVDDLVEEIDSTVGIENVQYLHLNDSKHPLGSEKDEHEHIGEGEIGEAGFRQFVNYDALREKPMVLETPEDERGYAWNIAKVTELRTDD